MTTLLEAAQQALEAYSLRDYDFGKYMEALRAALAEPTPLEDVVTYGSAWSKDGKRIDPMSVYAEPVQEPVAWLWQHRETGRPRLLMPNERTATDVAAAWDVVGPLYLAPPQRKPLTDEEIINIGKEAHAVEGPHILPVTFARAIERAHGIMP